jgi:hypothetical protein
MRKQNPFLKFTKLQGKFLQVAFKDVTTGKEYSYGKKFSSLPDWDSQIEYVKHVFDMCGVVSTWCDPLKNTK